MWPRPGEGLARTIAAETAVSDLFAEALRRWAPAARAAVLPSLNGVMVNGDPALIAATLPPNPGAMAQAQAAWGQQVQDVINPGLAILWAAAAYEATIGIGGTVTVATPVAAEGTAAAIVLALLLLDRPKVEQALGFVQETPALKAAFDGFMDAMASDLELTPFRVQAKVEAALANLTQTVEHAAVPEPAAPGVPAEPEPSAITITIIPENRPEVLRAEAENVLDPSSTEMRDIARNEGYQAAGVMNHAVLAAAEASAAELGEELEKAWICVHPDTVVSAAGVTHLARRRYEGALVSVSTASGARVSLTPQHRVLTGRGWIAAQSLNEGDDLFKVAGVDAARAPDVEDAPATIGQVVNAAMDDPAAKVWTVKRGVDFDGDAGSRYVDVVAVDGHLAINAEACCGEAFGDLFLSDADVLGHAAVLGRGAATGGVIGSGATAVLVGDAPVELSLGCCGYARGAKNTGRRFAAELNAGGGEYGSDLTAATGVLGAECLSGGSVEVGGDDVVAGGVEVVAVASGEGAFLGGAHLRESLGRCCSDLHSFADAAEDAAVAQSPADGFRAAAECRGDFDGALPGLVAGDDVVNVEGDALGAFRLDRVVAVEAVAHDGYVYDLSTVSHWYLANGLVTHNCTLDGKTRPTHWAAEGQRVALASPFTVGGEPLMYPGDETASPKEWKNCRCGLAILASDEDLPDEVDRHTERLDGRDSVAIHRGGRTQAEEIERRADAGNVRARDSEDGIGRVAAASWTAPSEQEHDMGNTAADTEQSTDAETFLTFSGYIGKLGVATSDRRILAADIDLTPREFPHPMAWQKQASGGHLDSYTVGVVEESKIDGDRVWARGYFLNSPEAMEAADQVKHRVSAPSLDLADAEYKFTDENGKEIEGDLFDWWEENGEPFTYFTKAEQTGFTLVQTPAFDGIDITLGARETRDLAVVAAIVAGVDGPRVQAYDPALFADPKLTRPTAPTMDNKTGRIYGHLAEWGHKIRGGRELTPRNHNSYANFHTSQVQLTNGKQLSVGRLTVQGGHADTRPGVTVATARAHYDNVCSAFGLVRVGEDAHGIWFSGVPAPGVDPETLQMGMTAPLSGDWRDCGGGLDMIAAHAVNSPGFPIYSAVTGPEGQDIALVASLGPSRASTKAAGGFTMDRDALKTLLTEVVETVDQRRVERESALAHRSFVETVLARAQESTIELPPEPTPTERVGQLLAERA